MESKRERSANFTRSESESLVSLIEKYKDTLESKKTDATTWKEKEAAWLRVANELNAIHGTCRTAKVLRAKYDNLKKMAKKDEAQVKTEAMGTGGGPPVYKKPDELLERVKALIGLSTASLPPRCDSRNECVVEKPAEIECQVSVSEDSDIIIFHDTSGITTMCDGLNPSNLKNPIHPALCVPVAADDGGEIEEIETTLDPGSPSERCAGPSHAVSTEEQRQTRNKWPRTFYTTNETRGLYNELALVKKKLVTIQNRLLKLEQLKFNEDRKYKREEHNKRLQQIVEEREFKREEHNKRMQQMDEEREFKREQQEFAREEHKKRLLLLDLEIAKMA